MVMLLNKDGSLIGAFDEEDRLFRYLQATINAAGGEEMQDWQFTYNSHRQLAGFVKEMAEKSLVFMAWNACQQKRDLITVGTGDAQNLSFFIVTPDLNVAKLKRDWCKQCCAAHGWRIVMG